MSKETKKAAAEEAAAIIPQETAETVAETTTDKTAEKTKNPVYKTKTGNYELLGKSYIFKQEKYNAKEAVKNKELMEALIAANSPALKKV
jgi:hypothetical protein